MLDTVAIVGFVGFVRRYERGYTAEREEGIRRGGALEVLKQWCEVRIGRTPGPSDVAEERRRPAVLSGAMISLWVGCWRS
jgi:hypothetical protein